MDRASKDAKSNLTELSVEKPAPMGMFDPEGSLEYPDAHLSVEEQEKLGIGAKAGLEIAAMAIRVISFEATCMTLMGFCSNGSGFLAARFFLGACEAGLFPGVNYLLSCWYRRSEIGLRMALFFSAAALAGSFGGLLASAIVRMDGIGGRPGWAWIFIVEGLATFIAGVISFWAVPPFPDEAQFLSEEDRARVRFRLAKDAQSSAKHEEFNMSYFWASVKDWKTYTGAITYMGCDGPLYGYSQFLPTIINDIVGLLAIHLAMMLNFTNSSPQGYSATKAQLMSVPPYAVAAVATIAVGFLADRLQQRGICNIIIAMTGMTGFIMLMASDNPSVKYAGTFLAALGIYPAIPNTIAWSSNNVEGVYKRGVTIGFVIGWGNLQGIVSSNVYRNQDKPQFYPGHGVLLAYITLFSFGGSIIQYVLLSRENEKRRRGDRNAEVDGLSQEEVMLRGDNRPDFLYTFSDVSPGIVPESSRLVPASSCKNMDDSLLGNNDIKEAIDELDNLAMQSGQRKSARKSIGSSIPGALHKDPPCVSSGDEQVALKPHPSLMPSRTPLIQGQVQAPDSPSSQFSSSTPHQASPRPFNSGFSACSKWQPLLSDDNGDRRPMKSSSEEARQSICPMQKRCAGNMVQQCENDQEHTFQPLSSLHTVVSHEIGARPLVKTESKPIWVEFVCSKDQAREMRQVRQQKQASLCTENAWLDSNVALSRSTGEQCDDNGKAAVTIECNESVKAVVADVTSPQSLRTSPAIARAKISEPSAYATAAANFTQKQAPMSSTPVSVSPGAPFDTPKTNQAEVAARWGDNQKFSVRPQSRFLDPISHSAKRPSTHLIVQNETKQDCIKENPSPPELPQLKQQRKVRVIPATSDRNRIEKDHPIFHYRSRDFDTMHRFAPRSMRTNTTLGEAIVIPSKKPNDLRNHGDANASKVNKIQKSLLLSKWAPKPAAAAATIRWADSWNPSPKERIRYVPTKPGIDDYRTVAIFDLPVNVTLADVTSIVRGGCVLSIHIVRQLPTRHGRQATMAIIVFHEGKNARAYVEFARTHGVYLRIDGPIRMRFTVALYNIPTVPPSEDMDSDICDNGCTRGLLIRRIPGRVQRDAMLKMLKKNYPLFFATTGLGSGMAEVIIPNDDDIDDDDGQSIGSFKNNEVPHMGKSCEIHFHSINAAMLVTKLLAKLPGLQTDFLVDPCSGPVEELLD
ncbi:hypothetical protein KEM54_005613 [Ascosphaera aggregata]|nr:hypothetical protein KEM54_005613 [Ascosphaera aggregata]